MISRRQFVSMAPLALAACRGRALAGEVNVYCWSDYVAPDTIAAFERETGVRVNFETFESEDEMLAKAIAGGSGWDVVFPSNVLIGPMERRRLLDVLDHQKLPNLGNLEPRFRAPQWDTEIRFSVPYMWGASGFVYNRRAIGRTLTSWADLWDPALKGKITMLDDPFEVFAACLKKLDDPFEVFAACLKKLGYGINSVDERELQAARAEAMRQKPLVRAYINAEVKPQLIAGDVWAAQLWNGDGYQAIAENKDLSYCLPAEGFALFADNAAILAGARHLPTAYRWIDYLLRPEVSATIATATMFATPNARAREQLAPALRENQDVYLPAERLAKAEWFAEISAEGQALRDRLWTEIKSA